MKQIFGGKGYDDEGILLGAPDDSEGQGCIDCVGWVDDPY